MSIGEAVLIWLCLVTVIIALALTVLGFVAVRVWKASLAVGASGRTAAESPLPSLGELSRRARRHPKPVAEVNVEGESVEDDVDTVQEVAQVGGASAAADAQLSEDLRDYFTRAKEAGKTMEQALQELPVVDIEGVE